MTFSSYSTIRLPPYKDPTQKSPVEAREFFDWFVRQMALRIEYLTSYLGQHENHVLNPQSIQRKDISFTWQWLRRNAEFREETPSERAAADAFVRRLTSKETAESITRGLPSTPHITPAGQTVLVTFDVAFLIASYLQQQHAVAHWFLPTKQKDMHRNEPVLALVRSGIWCINPHQLVMDSIWDSIRGIDGDILGRKVDKVLADVRSLKKPADQL